MATACVSMYFDFPLGLAPDTVDIGQDGRLRPHFKNYMQRPEVVERCGPRGTWARARGRHARAPQVARMLRPAPAPARPPPGSLFYLKRLTGDTRYEDWGWRIWQAIERWTRQEARTRQQCAHS